MKDYIFIIGPSGVGKTTLAKELFYSWVQSDGLRK